MSDVVDETEEGKPIEIRPMKAFPHIKDLVTDVSWNYEMAQKIKPINGPEEMNWEFNQNEAREELIDIWHFVVQASLELKLTPDDILDEYKRKNQINHEYTDYVVRDFGELCK